jgi:hypothetical protein
MRRLVDVERRLDVQPEISTATDGRPKSLTRIAVAPLKHSPKERVRLLVEDAYERAQERDCCDPRDLAESLFGLEPCPAPIKLPYIRGAVLYYPEEAAVDVRGLGLYYELALLLSPHSVEQVIDELILPTRTAKRLSIPELEQTQPHAPIQRVMTIYMRHGTRSGEWPAIR